MNGRPHEEVASHVREITDEEAAFYHENGWVMLRGLVSAELTSRLLRGAKAATEQADPQALHRLNPARDGVEPFRSLFFSEQIGRAAQRLANRARLDRADVPVRYHTDGVGRKIPGATGIPYHQDATEEGLDRNGRVRFWLALDEVTPEMGAMRFVSRVHREGPLGVVLYGDTVVPDSGIEDLLQIYPNLLDIYELSPPFHYQPGDATVHDGYMIHGAPSNTTDMTRWSYALGYMSADVRSINGRPLPPIIDSIERRISDDAEFPIVYAPTI